MQRNAMAISLRSNVSALAETIRLSENDVKYFHPILDFSIC
jgi:hypothetical protein